MDKLTLEHLAPFLTYAIRVCIGKTERNLTAISLDSPFVFVSACKGSREKEMVSIEQIKPILRPLSDLTKEIEQNEKRFVPISAILERFGDSESLENALLWLMDGSYPYSKFSYCIIELLISWHFDVFGLIEKGLAIDLNTLGKEASNEI